MSKSLSLEEVNQRLKQTFDQNVEVLEYTNRRSPIKIHCLECDFIWETSASTVLYEKNHKCPNCNKSNKIQLKCAYCGKTFERSKKDVKETKSGYYYCSRECGNRHKNYLRAQNGEWNDSQNYRLKAFEKLSHQCAICNWNEDERILEVHHKDGNRQNNSIDNLCILCPTCHRKITLGYYILTNDFKLESID